MPFYVIINLLSAVIRADGSPEVSMLFLILFLFLVFIWVYWGGCCYDFRTDPVICHCGTLSAEKQNLSAEMEKFPP